MRLRGSGATWLAGIVGGLAVLLIGGVILHSTGSGNASTQDRPKRSAPASSKRPSYGEFNLGIAYGMAPNEVLRRLGSPTSTHAGCWLYRGKNGIIRGHYSSPYVAGYPAAGYDDAIKYCFSEGPVGGMVVTQMFTHTPAHTIRRWDAATHTVVKRHFPAGWGPIPDFVKPPDWYLNQNS